MIVIPIEQGVPFQELIVRIENKDYFLIFKWNFRKGVWALEVLDIDREHLYSIPSLVLNTFSGVLYIHNSEAPRGGFSVIDTSFSNVEPTLESLGITHQIVFLTGSEISAMQQ